MSENTKKQSASSDGPSYPSIDVHLEEVDTRPTPTKIDLSTNTEPATIEPTPTPSPSPRVTATPPQDFLGPDNEVTDPNLRIPQPQTRTIRKPAVVAPPPPLAVLAPTGPAPRSISAAPAQTAPARTVPSLPQLGPLAGLMSDSTISEIMVNDLRNVMIERGGKLQFSGLRITSADELRRIIQAILDTAGQTRTLSPENPMIDVSLPDGSRVNIVGPPVTAGGPCLTIRKFPHQRFTPQELIQSGMMDQRIAYFLNVCVVGKLNVLISGGTGSGKTTLLGIMAGLIPRSERIISIEDTPELVLGHENSVSLLTKPATPTSPGLSARDLLVNSLRMRPDRVVVGECRRGEALDMLQAMNTGHEGSMTTLHANSSRDALSRLETLCLMAGVEIPHDALRKQIASALDILIQLKRFRDGSRRIIQISEITGMEGGTITLQDIFTHDGKQFVVTGIVPSFVERLKENGLTFPSGFFG